MNSVQISFFFKRKFHAKRLRDFRRIMDVTADTTILDVGGAEFDWQLFDEHFGFRPKVTILNLERPSSRSMFPWVVASGLDLPFADRSFDIVYSNSAIEHLFDKPNQQRFAAEVARVGRSYYVQTPNRWFLVEPHYLTPFIHYFPPRIQLKLLRNFTVWGWLTRPSPEICQRDVAEIRLLDSGEMISLFPAARIYRERVLGLTKSLIAVFSAQSSA
jgi:SAM-dependent methyltransferase